jgi:hypothetical protein
MPSRTTPLCTLHPNGDGCMSVRRAACCSLRTSYIIARAACGSQLSTLRPRHIHCPAVQLVQAQKQELGKEVDSE